MEKTKTTAEPQEKRLTYVSSGRAPGEEEGPQGPREEAYPIHSPLRQRHHDRRKEEDEPQPNLIGDSYHT